MIGRRQRAVRDAAARRRGRLRREQRALLAAKCRPEPPRERVLQWLDARPMGTRDTEDDYRGGWGGWTVATCRRVEKTRRRRRLAERARKRYA